MKGIGNMAPERVRNGEIDAVRQFNRFHTRLVGALNEHLLASRFSLAQSRILHEVASAPAASPPSARELGEADFGSKELPQEGDESEEENEQDKEYETPSAKPRQSN